MVEVNAAYVDSLIEQFDRVEEKMLTKFKVVDGKRVKFKVDSEVLKKRKRDRKSGAAKRRRSYKQILALKKMQKNPDAKRKRKKTKIKRVQLGIDKAKGKKK